MAATPTRLGFEGRIYWGTAGSTATTEMLSATDISMTITPKKAPTTTRGAGTSAPIETERVVSISISIEFTLLNKSGETHLDTLRAAAAAGTPVSLCMKDSTAGKGFDGDVTLECKEGMPLAGEQTFVFTATPTNEAGREPDPYTGGI